MNDNVRRWVPLIVLVVLVLAISVPGMVEKHQLKAFAAPLFRHPLPEQTELLVTDVARDEEGGTTAALLLKTALSSEALETFYADGSYAPAEKGQTVTVQAKALTEDDLQVVRQAELYEEGASYQFVYVYSR